MHPRCRARCSMRAGLLQWPRHLQADGRRLGPKTTGAASTATARFTTRIPPQARANMRLQGCRLRPSRQLRVHPSRAIRAVSKVLATCTPESRLRQSALMTLPRMKLQNQYPPSPRPPHSHRKRTASLYPAAFTSNPLRRRLGHTSRRSLTAAWLFRWFKSWCGVGSRAGYLRMSSSEHRRCRARCVMRPLRPQWPLLPPAARQQRGREAPGAALKVMIRCMPKSQRQASASTRPPHLHPRQSPQHRVPHSRAFRVVSRALAMCTKKSPPRVSVRMRTLRMSTPRVSRSSPRAQSLLQRRTALLFLAVCTPCPLRHLPARTMCLVRQPSRVQCRCCSRWFAAGSHVAFGLTP
mmetsp:Transcript_1816/g.5947  ORF Transcript_1816/g.5947 Transcript_1816/m.5947 type:complete len:352 (-) Transcript_1816:1603-2658(-)